MASGDTLIIFHPYHNVPPTSAFATLDIRNYHPVLDFGEELTEEAIFNAVMPQHYEENGVTIYIHYSMTTAANKKIQFTTQFERIGDQQQDIDSDSFALGSATGSITVPGTSGLVDIITTTHTNLQIDGILVGEGFRLKVILSNIGGSGASGDTELLFVEIKET